MVAIRRFQNARNLLALVALSVSTTAVAQPKTDTVAKPYQVEWVYRVRYGFQNEWWRLFQKYQIAELDEEKRRGFVRGYAVFRPSLHMSEDSRWDYRIVITYNGYDGSTHEGEVEKALFSDVATRKREEDRRWELTVNHWDLPVHEIDPHASAE